MSLNGQHSRYPRHCSFLIPYLTLFLPPCRPNFVPSFYYVLFHDYWVTASIRTHSTTQHVLCSFNVFAWGICATNDDNITMDSPGRLQFKFDVLVTFWTMLNFLISVNCSSSSTALCVACQCHLSLAIGVCEADIWCEVVCLYMESLTKWVFQFRGHIW